MLTWAWLLAAASTASGVHISLNLTAGPAPCLHGSGLCGAASQSRPARSSTLPPAGGPAAGAAPPGRRLSPDSTAGPTGLHAPGPWAGHKEGEQGAVCVRVCAHVCGFWTATESCKAAGLSPAPQPDVPGGGLALGALGAAWHTARRVHRVTSGMRQQGDRSQARGRSLPLLGLECCSRHVREGAGLHGRRLPARCWAWQATGLGQGRDGCACVCVGCRAAAMSRTHRAQPHSGPCSLTAASQGQEHVGPPEPPPPPPGRACWPLVGTRNSLLLLYLFPNLFPQEFRACLLSGKHSQGGHLGRRGPGATPPQGSSPL